MKKIVFFSKLFPIFLVSGLFLSNVRIIAQEAAKTGQALPDDVDKIVTASCKSCHSSDGKLMAKSKLNFTEWTNYSQEKQKEKAAKMYSELKKGAMPPKAARAKRPDLIPTKDQIEIIKKWSESFPAGSK